MSISAQSARPAKITPDDPCHPEHDAYLAWLRDLSMEQRGWLILEVCRKAWAEEQARIAAGLPPTEPDPIPPDTLELFRRWAAQSRSESEDRKPASINASE